MSPEWEKMTKAEQVALGTTLAGVNQYKVFSAVMTNFNTAIKATNDALGSEGSALRENAKYMESIKAKTQALKAEIQKLVFEQNILQNSFKAILDILIKVAQFFTSAYGKAVLLETALALIGKTIFVRVIPFIKSLILTIQAEEVATGKAITATEAFNLALKSLELQPAVVAITAILAITIALTVAMYKLSKATEEYIEDLKEQKNIIDDAKSNIESYEDELEKITKKIEEINNSGLDLDKNSEDNLRKLRLEQVELERLLKLEQQRRKEAQDEANKKAEKFLNSEIFESSWIGTDKRKRHDMSYLRDSEKELLVGGGYIDELSFNKQSGKAQNQIGGLKVALTYVQAYSDKFDELSAKKEKYGKLSEEEQKQLELYKDKLTYASEEAAHLATNVQQAVDSSDKTIDSYSDANEVLLKYDEIMNNVGESSKEIIGLSDDLTDENEEEQESVEDLADAWKYNAQEKLQAQEILDNLGLKEKELQQQLGMSSLELARQANEWHTSGEALFHYLTNLKQLNEAIDDVQSNYQILKSAVDEYNESGGFSVDTLQELLSLSPEYLQTIFDESGELRLQNGVLQLNEQAIKDKVSAMASEAKQNIYNTAIERISNLSKDENTKEAIKNKEAYEESTNAIKEHKDALLDDAYAEYLNTIAKNRASGGSAKDTYINQIIKETEEQIALVDKMVEGLGKDFSKSMGGATNSTKDTNNALKEQNNLLKQQKQLLEEKKKQYESVVAYIKKKIQDEIKSIEEEKKAQVDAIKDQIEALKDLKEEELDRIQEQIDALKDQKDIEKEYWQSKIDALKEQNDELKDQLEYEELLENLAKAKAKRVRVYKDGKFTYTEDSNEVDKAQAKINEYERKKSYEEQLKVLENYKKQSENNYDEQIKALEKLKEEKEKNYEQQIKDLEKYQEQVEADYDARIQYFQDYLDKFTKQTDAYENETNRQLAIQLTGIDFEQQGWQTRLDNLADFVEKYNALLGDINSLDDTDLGTDDTTTTTTKTQQENDGNDDDSPKDTRKEKGTYTSISSSTDLSKNAKSSAVPVRTLTTQNVSAKAGISTASNSLQALSTLVKKKASGDSSIKDDGMYLVGDSPNQELVIGSKLNGNLMNLTQGSGVVNATATRTLAGMLNQLGFANQGVNVSNNQNKSTNINIGNISLPSVQNGKDFVDYLQNFSLQMTQEAFA